MPFVERLEALGKPVRAHEAGEDRLLRSRPAGENRARHLGRAGRERRNEDDDHGVDILIGRKEAEGLLVRGRVGRGDHVDRILDARLGREEGPERLHRLRLQRWEREARRFAGVGRHDPRSAGVRENRDPVSRGDRLIGEQERGVEQILDRVGPDDAALMEEGVDRDVRPCQRAGMRRRGPRAALRAAALHRHDRLLPRDAAGDLRELPGIAERFEVEKDEIGPFIALPELDQVVPRDVGLVAHAHELRDAERESPRVVEDREAQGSALRRKRDPAGKRVHRRECRVQGDGGIRVEEAETVRAHEPHPVAAGRGQELSLPFGPLGADFLEARRDDDESSDALPAARLDGLEHVRRGDDDDREVDVAWNRLHVGVGGDRLDVARVGIDRVDRSLKARLEQVAENRATE